ncbi:MAG TPA: BadF/BadG/BcrA/BcrD ATPase family protein, partial [Gemmatimonadales bacterium]|nr:BadF/BadG/BcrA/BcrD ATPase family protein [Gemmatimonadales bacterium]
MTEQAVGPSGRPAVLLGVDCGGSHTALVVGDRHARVLSRAEGPGSAMRPGGEERSAAVILDVARRATAEAQVSLPATLALVGAAGAGRAPEQEALARAITAAGVADRVEVRSDMEIALAAAFGNKSGILINAGTGSIAYARTPDGRLHRAGGHGWQLGDEGSGYWLGRRALAAAARAQDGLEESSTLLERLLVTLGLQTFDDLIRWTATATPAQVAALAPHVLNAAREGEIVAQRIVADAAVELSQLVAVLTRQFPELDTIKMATIGGLLRPGSPLLTALRTNLAVTLPRARLSESGSPVDAPVGALRLAA